MSSNLATTILNLSGEQTVSELINYLDEKRTDIIKMPVEERMQALERMNPRVNTLGVLGLLMPDARSFKTFPADHEAAFLRHAGNFLRLGDPTMFRRKISDVYTVGRTFARLCITGRKPKAGILALRAAIRAIARRDPRKLTPLHAQFVLLCILAKSHDVALEVVEQPFDDVETKWTGFQMLDFLTYHYYAAKVCCVMDRFDRALELLQAVVTAPCADNAVSKVQIEAYKKYVLVSLLVHGRLVQLPRTTGEPVKRAISALPKNGGYAKLAEIFERKDITKLGQFVAGESRTFQSDENWGLVKRVLSARAKRNVQQLNRTFVTLSFAGIASNAKLEDAAAARKLVTQMVEDGELSATISAKDDMVSFADPADVRVDTQAMAEKLKAKIHQAVSLTRRVRVLDRRLQLDDRLVRAEMRDAQRQKGGKGSSKSRKGESASEFDQDLNTALERSTYVR